MLENETENLHINHEIVIKLNYPPKHLFIIDARHAVII